MINDEKVWLEMLSDRNISVHNYNEIESRNIFERIKSLYVKEFKILGKKLKDILSQDKD